MGIQKPQLYMYMYVHVTAQIARLDLANDDEWGVGVLQLSYNLDHSRIRTTRTRTTPTTRNRNPRAVSAAPLPTLARVGSKIALK